MSTALSDYVSSTRYTRYSETLGRLETWEEAAERVRDMHLQFYADKLALPLWEGRTLGEWIGEAFEAVKRKEILPSMRSLQFGGPAILANHARCYNCSFRPADDTEFFKQFFWLLLCGTGVGFSVQKHHVEKLGCVLDLWDAVETFVVPDTIEGWALAIDTQINNAQMGWDTDFDFSLIRPKGALLKTSGGRAPGPEPLKLALSKTRDVLRGARGRKLRPIEVYDICMHLAKAVLSGGIRRSATICLFSPDDEEMKNAKATDKWWETHPQRTASNNSAMLCRATCSKAEFDSLFEAQKAYGDPGFYVANDVNHGTNPCAEIGLYPYDQHGHSGVQFCNLSTIAARGINSPHEFFRRARLASLIGTLQAGYDSFPFLGSVSENITRCEALLGVSICGILDNPSILLQPDVLRNGAMVVRMANVDTAAALDINPATRTTCVKPEGCQVPSTLLATSAGFLTLEELNPRTSGEAWQDLDTVVATDRRTEACTKFFSNGIAPTKRISTTGGVPLEATHNHQFRVLLPSGEYVWKRSDAIQVGDILPYRVGYYGGGSFQTLVEPELHPSPHATNLKKLSYPKTLAEDFAWFLGLYFGDGSNHERGIRISGNVTEKADLEKAAQFAKDAFGIEGKFQDYLKKGGKDLRCQLYLNSTSLLAFLEVNGLLKQHSKEIGFPAILRRSPASVLRAFLSGLLDADGCREGASWSYVTSSERQAREFVIVARAVGLDCTARLYTPSAGAYSRAPRYWISERKGRALADPKKVRGVFRSSWAALDLHGLSDFSVDEVTAVEDGISDTYDVTVPETHTYLSNGYVSHNTASIVLDSASGIHPRHAAKYLRRVRASKADPATAAFAAANPELVEDSYEDPLNTSVLTFACSAPAGARLREDVSALELLEAAKIVQENWVVPGRSAATATDIHHNVSITVTVKPDEWESVREHIWADRETYTGVALLQDFGDTAYPQAPLQTVRTPEELAVWEKALQAKLPAEWRHEATHDTGEEHRGAAVACSGGSCELKV